MLNSFQGGESIAVAKWSDSEIAGSEAIWRWLPQAAVEQHPGQVEIVLCFARPRPICSQRFLRITLCAGAADDAEWCRHRTSGATKERNFRLQKVRGQKVRGPEGSWARRFVNGKFWTTTDLDAGHGNGTLEMALWKWHCGSGTVEVALLS